MNTSTRRSINYPQADRSDAPDVPAHIKSCIDALEVDLVYKQGTHAARLAQGGLYEGWYWFETDTKQSWYYDGSAWNAVSSGIMGADIASAGTISAALAPSHKITGTTPIDTITDSLAYAGKTVTFIFQATNAIKHNVGNIKLVGGIWAGFVANETITLVYDGASWIEQGRSARHLCGMVSELNSTSVLSGYAVEDGSAISRTGFAALFSLQGTSFGVGDGSTTFNLADKRGRMAVTYASGGHTDVATLGNTEGGALGTRRPKHKHTVNESAHHHTQHGTGTGGPGASGSLVDSGHTDNTGDATTGLTVGPQTGNEPTDSAAYIVKGSLVRL